jgi:hypothetical protein
LTIANIQNHTDSGSYLARNLRHMIPDPHSNRAPSSQGPSLCNPSIPSFSTHQHLIPKIQNRWQVHPGITHLPQTFCFKTCTPAHCTCFFKNWGRRGKVVQACYSRYLGGRDQEDHSLWPSRQKFTRLHLDQSLDTVVHA